MILPCWYCKRSYPVEDWRITRLDDARLYGGGGIYGAKHRRCGKLTYLPDQMGRNVTRAARSDI